MLKLYGCVPFAVHDTPHVQHPPTLSCLEPGTSCPVWNPEPRNLGTWAPAGRPGRNPEPGTQTQIFFRPERVSVEAIYGKIDRPISCEWGEVNGEPAILRFAISEEEHERALTLVSATSRRAPPVESDEDEDEDEEAGGAPAAAAALGPPPRRLTLRHGRKVPAVKYF